MVNRDALCTLGLNLLILFLRPQCCKSQILDDSTEHCILEPREPRSRISRGCFQGSPKTAILFHVGPTSNSENVNTEHQLLQKLSLGLEKEVNEWLDGANMFNGKRDFKGYTRFRAFQISKVLVDQMNLRWGLNIGSLNKGHI